MSLTIKTEFKRSNGEFDIRRTRLVDGSDRYVQLINYLDSTYGQVYGIAKSAYVLSYVDPDGDACSINSDAEVVECSRCASDEGKTAKIKVRVAEDMSASTWSQLSDSLSVSQVSQVSQQADAPSPVNAAVSVSQPGSTPQPSAPEIDSDSEYVRVDTSRPATPSAASISVDATPAVPSVQPVAKTAPSVTVEDITEEDRDENALVEAIMASFTAPSSATPQHAEEKKANVVPSPFTTVTSTVTEVKQDESKVDSVARTPARPAATAGVHLNVVCDACDASPIVGDRYKCSICHDFDLCSTCENSGKSFGRHSAQHSMIKIPAPGRANVCPANNESAPASTPASASTSSTSAADVHAGVRCDVCGVAPIQGVRYKCTSCHNYDLCANCEAKNEHDPKHVLLKMRHHLTGADVQNAILNRVSHWWRRGGHGHGHHGMGQGHHGMGRGPFGGRHCGGFRNRHDSGAPADDVNRPRAAFISDNVADNTVVAPGANFQKVWSIQNTGDKEWPQGCQLIFTGGDLTSADQSGTPVEHSINSVPVSAQPGETVNVKIDIQAPLEEGRFRSTFRLVTPQNERFGPRMWVDVIVKKSDADSDSVPKTQSTPAGSAAASTPSAQSTPSPTFPVAEPVQQDPIRGAIQTLVSALGPALTQQGGNSAVQSFFDLIQGHGRSTPRNEQAAPRTAEPAETFRFQSELVTIREMGVEASDETLIRLLNRFNGNVSRTLTHLFEGST